MLHVLMTGGMLMRILWLLVLILQVISMIVMAAFLFPGPCRWCVRSRAFVFFRLKTCQPALERVWRGVIG